MGTQSQGNDFSALAIIQSSEPKEMVQTMSQIRAYQSLIHSNFVEGHDYGVIPGTGTKPVLLKPGAEKLLLLFKLNAEYEFMVSTSDFDKGFFNYEIRCTLYKAVVQDGVLIQMPVAQGIGACNSMEEKYRYLWVYESDLPAGTDRSLLKSKQFTNKNNGSKYVKYRVVNSDPATLQNTIMKMGKKRALIDASLQLSALSEIFTQDIEEMPGFVNDDADEPTPPPVQRSAPRGDNSDPGSYILKTKRFGELSIRELYDSGTKGVEYLGWMQNNWEDKRVVEKIAAFLASMATAPAQATVATPEEKAKAKVAKPVAPPVTDDQYRFPDDSEVPLPFDLT